MPGCMVQGAFLERPNRFLIRCRIDGKGVDAQLLNSGRLAELLLPGVTVYPGGQFPAPPRGRCSATVVPILPDAVTERGRRHLLELAELGSQAELGGRPKPAAVLSLVHSDRVDRFLPDYHTDLDFSRPQVQVRNRVRILPVALGWTPSLELKGRVKSLPIPWDFVERETRDCGAYLLLMRLAEDRRIRVGKWGELALEKGLVRLRRLGHAESDGTNRPSPAPSQASPLARGLPARRGRRVSSDSDPLIPTPGVCDC